MYMIYKFDKKKTDFINIHSFVKNVFGNEKIYPTFYDNQKFLIVSDHKPKDSKGLTEVSPLLNVSNGDKITVNVIFAFDSRRSLNREKSKRVMDRDSTLGAFFKYTGLSDIDCALTGPGQSLMYAVRNFTINNIYRVYGDCTVVDSEKFKKACETGIGGRKTYGYGLIRFIPL